MLSYRVAFFLGIAGIVIGAVRFAYMAGFLEEIGHLQQLMAPYQ